MKIDLRTFNDYMAKQEASLSSFDSEKHKQMCKDGLESTRQAVKKLCDKGNLLGIMLWLPSWDCLRFVFQNFEVLKEIGDYEEALIDAYQGTKFNFHHWPLSTFRFLFEIADPKKLRKLGDPIPDKDFFTLYRGVAGKGRARRVNGISWTASSNIAAWFATWLRRWNINLDDPAVFEITVPKNSLLLYINERKEQEYLLKLPLPNKPRRLKEMPKPKIDRTIPPAIRAQLEKIGRPIIH